jgi:hypothetical protein
MCCFVVVLMLLGPRFALAFEWIFGNRVQVAFHGGWIEPLLGLVLLPWTTLMYVFAYAPVGGVSGIGWLFVGLGLFADIATWLSGPTQRRRQASA